jgi:hypothetical protein
MSFRLLKSPFEKEFRAAIRQVQRELVVSSPYINDAGTAVLFDSIDNASKKYVHVLTNLSARNIVDNVTQPSALLKFYDTFQETTITSLPKLHAKVYIVDETAAIITSANLTYGGLHNFEYGILTDDTDTIKSIKQDILDYSSLGNVFDKVFLTNIEKASRNIAKIKIKREKRQSSELEKLLSETEEKIEFNLLENSIKGVSRNQIFVKTITYLLSKFGHLKLNAIYEFVKEIHPVLCNDDVIFRAFGSKHYGKKFGIKWQHDVRSALYTYLIRSGVVASQGTGKKGETEFFLAKQSQ